MGTQLHLLRPFTPQRGPGELPPLGPAARGAIFLIRLYQRWLSPLLPPSCRFMPTCSHYAIEALSRYGLWQGGWLALRRLLRCHPFSPGGWDPVPPSLLETTQGERDEEIP